MPSTNVVTEREWFIDAFSGEPARAHLPIDGVVITEQVILAADGNGSPVAVGILLGFVNLIFSDIRLETFRILLHPVRMFVRADPARWLRAVIHSRGQNLKVLDAIEADRVGREW